MSGTERAGGTSGARHLFGAHVQDAGGPDMAVRRAANAGMRSLQLFTAIPKFYNDRVGAKPERVARFRAAVDDAGLRARDMMVHAAYVLNTASADAEKWTRARDGLARELERSTAYGMGMACFHPGSAGKDGDRAEAAERVGTAIAHALAQVEGETRLLVENTAGAGATMGRTPQEIAAILSHVPAAERHRTGYGLDTCHLFASGYDLRAGREEVRRVLDEFERVIGEPPAFFHLNDSEGGLGTNRDRHMLIGEGQIGVEAFRWLLADPRSRGVPLILETPQERGEVAEDDASPDPWDVRMVRLLESLAG